MTESSQEQSAATRAPDPSTSPFERPGVMTGYPLSREEQERVDRVVKNTEAVDEDADD